MTRPFERSSAGQSAFEYATLLAAVGLAIGAISAYLEKSAKSNLSTLEQELNKSANEKPGGPEQPTP